MRIQFELHTWCLRALIYLHIWSLEYEKKQIQKNTWGSIINGMMFVSTLVWFRKLLGHHFFKYDGTGIWEVNLCSKDFIKIIVLIAIDNWYLMFDIWYLIKHSPKIKYINSIKMGSVWEVIYYFKSSAMLFTNQN